MRQTEIIDGVFKMVLLAGVAIVMTSCGNDSRGNRNDCDASESPSNAFPAVEAARRPHVQTKEEEFAAKFRRFSVLRKEKSGNKSTWKLINELCNEICNLPKAQAVTLLDQFVDMAIGQPVTETDYLLRAAWFRQLFYVIHEAFCSAQYLQKESFGHWERLFSFFTKCTDEITSVEKTLPLTDSRFWGRKDKDRGRYLLGIRGDFKTWVHVMRDFYFPELSKGLTEEQKADILRRFDELKKYMVTPPNFPGGKK